MKSRPTQFGVRENTASSRRHASRLVVSPPFLHPGTLSLSEHTCMPPSSQTLNYPLENGRRAPRVRKATALEAPNMWLIATAITSALNLACETT